MTTRGKGELDNNGLEFVTQIFWVELFF